DRLRLPIPDSDMDAYLPPYYHPGRDHEETEYMVERRRALGGFVPSRRTLALPLPQPPQESFEVAARHGLRAFTTNSGRPVSNLKEGWDNYLAARAKYPTAPEDFGVQVQVIVADTDAEAKKHMGAFLYQTRQVSTLRGGHEHVVSGVSEPMPFEGEPTLDEMFEYRTLSGSPETVVRKLKEYQAVAPMSLLNCVFHGGDMPADVARHSMRLFAQEVMPHFQ
ncbi:MAG: LLM class flavin-dependent oxidoreductase, partial [Chloroflexota bacterium]